MNKDIVNYFVKEINELHIKYNKKITDCMDKYENKIKILEKENEKLKSLLDKKRFDNLPSLQKNIKSDRFKNLPPLKKH